MIKIVNGYYGPNLLGPGTILTLSKEKEDRLIRNGIAVSVKTEYENGSEEHESTNVHDEVLEIDVKSEEELRKLRSKKELIAYAVSIGLHGLNEDAMKEELIKAILNYIEENFEEAE